MLTCLITVLLLVLPRCLRKQKQSWQSNQNLLKRTLTLLKNPDHPISPPSLLLSLHSCRPGFLSPWKEDKTEIIWVKALKMGWGISMCFWWILTAPQPRKKRRWSSVTLHTSWKQRTSASINKCNPTRLMLSQTFFFLFLNKNTGKRGSSLTKYCFQMDWRCRATLNNTST